MALDAIAVKALVNELQCLVGGRIDKVHQPERDEIVIHVRTYDESYKLVLSASSANPRIHLTERSKKNPAVAPMFCMLLRKHIGSGKITAIEQTGFERIVRISIESYNELGDLTVKHIVAEIMGRYSNVILVSEEGRIIDSVKRVDGSVSSVREILPGGEYCTPPSQDKVPLTEFDNGSKLDLSGPVKADRALLASVAGISPLTAREIVYRVFGTTDVNAGEISINKAAELKLAVIRLAEKVRHNEFSPCIITDSHSGRLIEFSAIDIKQYETLAEVKSSGSMNEAVDDFYYMRDMHERMRQKSGDVSKLLNNNIERVSKKLSILEKTVHDAENREKYKIRGDLITANIYRISEGMKEIELENFYDPSGQSVKIALDPSLSPSMNAQRYYKKYSKAKNALVEAAKQIEAAREDLDYLESTLYVVEHAETVADINAVKEELAALGYISRRGKQTKKRGAERSKPMHFVSSDGFDIYVGRNNTQNDHLTLRFANTSDMWFHTKDIHGSHVVIKLGIDKDIPKTTILEAARLAAYYSQARESSQVPVDYTQIRNVKKPNGAKPGMVIYESYNTVYVTPGLIRESEEQK